MKHKKGFSEELNRFLQSLIEFRKDGIFIPRSVIENEGR